MNQPNNQPASCSHWDVPKYIYLKAQTRAQSLICQDCKLKNDYNSRDLVSFNDLIMTNSPDQEIEFQIFNIQFKINNILDEVKQKTKHLLQQKINAIKDQNNLQINKEAYYGIFDILKADGSQIKQQLFHELAKFLQPYQDQQKPSIELPQSTIFLQNNQSQIINQDQRIIQGQQNNQTHLKLNGICQNINHNQQPLKYISIDKNDEHPLKCQRCISEIKQNDQNKSQLVYPVNELTLEALNIMYNSKVYETFKKIEECSFTLLTEGHKQIKVSFENLTKGDLDMGEYQKLISIIDTSQNHANNFLTMIKKRFEGLQRQIVKFYKLNQNLDTKDEIVFKNNYAGNMVLIKLENLYTRYRLKVKNNQSTIFLGVTNIDTIDWNKFLEEKDKKKYFYMISQKGRIYSLQNGNREGHQKDDQWTPYKFEDQEQLIEIIDGKVKLFIGNQARQNNNYTFKDVKVSKGDFLCMYFTGENEIELEVI
ncbi:hypothetical protein pb186bvf_007218 [Paramecium bursaria]